MIADKSIFRRIDESGIPLLLARLVGGGLFIYMALPKIGEPSDFLKLTRLYHIVPESPPYFLNGIAIVLPWLEIVCGAALVLGIFVRGASALIALMLAVFTPVILFRALSIHAEQGTPFLEIAFDCGCGAGVQIIWRKLLANTGLFLLSILPLLSRSRRFCLALWFERRRPAAQGLWLDAPEEIAGADRKT
jgi:uncharacterized membrane protein YphA (DoxX/SURF4 family)